MLIAKDLCLTFGTQVIFDHISFTVGQHQKVGLVGRNGAGKSTLLKVIAQAQSLDAGEVSIERGKKVAYMPQDVVLLSSKNVLDEAFSTFSDIFTLKQELDELECFFSQQTGVTSDPAKVERYAHLLTECEGVDFAGLKLQTQNVLHGLGFNQERLQMRVDQLSVGWKMRLVLAKLLLQNADLYLFDEPTNHLDIIAKDWFLDFLKNAGFGFLLVSHDRYFLDHICDHIFELDRGQGSMYYGNYTSYLEQKEQAAILKERAYVQQQKEIKRKMETINRFKASASRASTAQSMLKSLEKIELIEPDRKQGAARFSFAPVARAGEVVLSIEHVSKLFGNTCLFKNANFQIFRGEKVALVAANGVGKTTLLSIIMGKESHQAGKIIFGHNVTTSFFEQDQERSLNRQKTILEEVEDSCTTSSARALVRGMLGAFLFPGDDVQKRISVLSGGEKNRVAMVKVLLTQANFLILDEPTNHLDLDSKEILLQALQQYQGTILFVSHDRTFLDALATRIIELSPHGIRSYKGNYESYIYCKKQEQQQVSASSVTKKQQEIPIHHAPSHQPKEIPHKAGKEAYEQRKKRNQLESRIERLEKEKIEQEQRFAQAEWGSAEHQLIDKRLKEVIKLLENAYQEWNKISA